MSKYIPTDKLKAEIEKLSNCRERPEFNQMEEDAYSRALDEIKNLITSLQQEAEVERIKEQKELNKISIRYRDDVIAHIEEKRVLPSFKGQLLHDFKNEVNTMRQILGVVSWDNIQNTLFEKFALVFATWGGYHFHPKEMESEDSLQQEQPDKYETALEKAREWTQNVNQGGHAILIDIFPELEEGLDPRYSGRKNEQPEVELEKEVEFECISKKVKMTIQELINYYIDRECCDVADECGF